eukprot:m.145409 g.145409  ORF g.145409 m.145409 type:complete len:52 (+) comp17733_c0_seq8:169-324(+)
MEDLGVRSHADNAAPAHVCVRVTHSIANTPHPERATGDDSFQQHNVVCGEW